MSIWCQFFVKFFFQDQCLDVKLTSYLMSNCWCQFDVNFWSKIFFKVNVLMWNWRYIWRKTIDINVLMSNQCHIWCQTADVNLMSIFGQKSFSRSMSWCEIDVIFGLKLLMSMFWCYIDIIFDVKLLMSIWCQFLVKVLTIFWKNVLMWNWRHIWCQTIDVNALMLNWRHIWCQTFDVNLM